MGYHQDVFKDTLAVIVIYEMEPHASTTYRSLEKSIQAAGGKMDLLIYDNSSTRHEAPVSDKWIIHYEHDPSNGGVSKAYNQGFDVAKHLGKKWLWLLDQDDVFNEDAIPAYQKALSENPDSNIFVPTVVDEKLTLCSPFRFWFGGGWRVTNINPGIYSLQQFKFINSGLFISISTFEEANGYDVEFPLDFSDLVFIERLKKKQENFVVVPTTLHHHLSSNANQPAKKKIARFLVYLKGARLFRQRYSKRDWSINLRNFGRALRLSVQHNSIKYLTALFDF